MGLLLRMFFSPTLRTPRRALTHACSLAFLLFALLDSPIPI